MSDTRHTSSHLVLSPNASDVLFGRGAQINNHEGNVRYRRLIQAKKDEYLDCTTNYEKDVLARAIGAAVVNQGGRFLQKKEVEHSEVWEVVGERSALLKVKQAFRDHTRISAGSQQGVASGLVGDNRDAEKPPFVGRSDWTPRPDLSDEGSRSMHQRLVAHQSLGSFVSQRVMSTMNAEFIPQSMLPPQSQHQNIANAVVPTMNVASMPESSSAQLFTNPNSATIEAAQMRHLSQSLQQQTHQRHLSVLGHQREIQSSPQVRERTQFTGALQLQQAALQLQHQQPSRSQATSTQDGQISRSLRLQLSELPLFQLTHARDVGMNVNTAQDAALLNRLQHELRLLHPTLLDARLTPTANNRSSGMLARFSAGRLDNWEPVLGGHPAAVAAAAAHVPVADQPRPQTEALDLWHQRELRGLERLPRRQPPLDDERKQASAYKPPPNKK